MKLSQKTKNWLELADRDLAFAEEIYHKSNFRSYSPHYCHQAIEKLIKAIIVNQTDENPPYIHNLVRLAGIAKIELNQEDRDMFASLNPHYLSTKYPEDIAKMFKTYDQKKVKEIYEQTTKVFKWLKTNLK